jgi:tellurite resistance protein
LAYVLVGYTVLMVLVQIRLLPVYLKLPFAPTFWSLAFSYAAVAAYALRWIQSQDPVGATPMDLAVLDATTLLIGAIALRSLAALRQGISSPRRHPDGRRRPRNGVCSWRVPGKQTIRWPFW